MSGDPAELSIAQGSLRGRATEAGWCYLGIPYAPAPVGALRFAEPGAPPSWPGVRDAREYGPTAPKPGYPEVFVDLLPEPMVAGEQCLNLNVWTPDPSAVGLPVLVWVHGGSFTNGSSAVSAYQGSRFARDGVVFVSLNYRLGVLGFGHLPDAPDNRGLLDQLAALRWVRDNIAQFGGDPDRVTVSGESAGAMSVTTLMSLPEADGLFHQVIAQSGAGQHVLSTSTAAKVTAALAERLSVQPTAAALTAVPIERLIAEQAALALQIQAEPDPGRWGEIVLNGMAFEPVLDGELLARPPIEAIAAGAGAGISVLTGTNTDEHALFLVPTGLIDAIPEQALKPLIARFGIDPTSALAAYRRELPAATPGELLVAAISDWFFRVPAVRLAQACAGRAYLYEFGWRSPALGGRLGACHALEIAFVFDTLDDGQSTIAGEHPPQALADAMHRAWIRFVEKGDPGWPDYAEQCAVMRFDEISELTHAPRQETLSLWDGIR